MTPRRRTAAGRVETDLDGAAAGLVPAPIDALDERPRAAAASRSRKRGQARLTSARGRVFGAPEPDDEDAGRLPRGSFARALVVDDDRQVRELLCRMLARWGTSVVGARGLAEGRLGLERMPDLVLVDLCLPDGSGVALAREAAALRPAPLIVGMSGRASPDESFALGRAGVRAFLVKPFTERQLSAAASAALAEHETSEVRAGRPRDLSEVTRSILVGALDAFCARHAMSPRQRQVVAEIVKGTPRAVLASVLGISENTCKTYIRRILARCGLERTADVPAAVLEHARLSGSKAKGLTAVSSAEPAST